jgi:hypothetical protein
MLDFLDPFCPDGFFVKKTSFFRSLARFLFTKDV